MRPYGEPPPVDYAERVAEIRRAQNASLAALRVVVLPVASARLDAVAQRVARLRTLGPLTCLAEIEATITELATIATEIRLAGPQ